MSMGSTRVRLCLGLMAVVGACNALEVRAQGTWSLPNPLVKPSTAPIAGAVAAQSTAKSGVPLVRSVDESGGVRQEGVSSKAPAGDSPVNDLAQYTVVAVYKDRAVLRANVGQPIVQRNPAQPPGGATSTQSAQRKPVLRVRTGETVVFGGVPLHVVVTSSGVSFSVRGGEVVHMALLESEVPALFAVPSSVREVADPNAGLKPLAMDGASVTNATKPAVSGTGGSTP